MSASQPNYSAIEVRYWSRATTREQYRNDIAELLDRCELLEGKTILAKLRKKHP